MRSLYRVLWRVACLVLTAGAACAQTLPKAEYACNFGNPDPQDKSGESVVYRCRPQAGSGAPVFNVAVLKGSPSEVYRAHGYLLAREAEIGPLSEAIDLVNFGIAQQRPALRPTLENVVTCFSRNLFNSLNPEFQANLAAFDEGYRQRLGPAAKYPASQQRLAAVGIELDNIMTAIDYRHGTLRTAWIAERNCPGHLFFKVIFDGGLKLFGRDKGLGCTAFAIPAKSGSGAVFSREGLIVGRTLDAELMRSWNRAPTLFVMHEEGRDDQGRPFLSYVATGSAGLVYSGGISGFNTEGIAVSLHQMYASDTILSVPAKQARKAALAPVVQQIVLREARSIDDAVRIAGRYQAIATWTILIADAKTGETAAIEITKGGVKLVRRTRDEPLAQTNHVFDKAQQAYAYFPSFNKYNETHTRMATLEKGFARLKQRAAGGSPVEAADAVALLASHEDGNGRLQPFGTTPVKAYDAMSTVMLPQARKIYMTAGDFAPSPHATYLGFQLDAQLNPIGLAGTLRDETLAGTPGVLRSLSDYVQARLAYELKNYPEAERLLRQAIAQAGEDGTNGADPAFKDRKAGSLSVYNYVLARLMAMKATQKLYGDKLSPQDRRSAYEEARERFMAVIKDPGVLPYQRALAQYHYGLAEQKFRNNAIRGMRMSQETVALVNDALGVFQSSYQAVKPAADIKDMASDIANAKRLLNIRERKSPDAAAIDWVVIR